MWSGPSHLPVSNTQYLNHKLLNIIHYTDVVLPWLMLEPAQSSRQLHSSAMTNVMMLTFLLGQFADRTAMPITRCAIWNKKLVALEWFQCLSRTVQRPPCVRPIVNPSREATFADRTTSSIVPNVWCVARTVADTCLWFLWNGAWPHSRSKDVLEFVHKSLSQFAARTERRTRTNASWTSKTVGREA